MFNVHNIENNLQFSLNLPKFKHKIRVYHLYMYTTEYMLGVSYFCMLTMTQGQENYLT